MTDLTAALDYVGGKDLFMDDVLVYLQEAIDGGYSKTHSIVFGWHPEQGIIEMRGIDASKVLKRMIGIQGITRIAACRQRAYEDEGYVVRLVWASVLLTHMNSFRVYQMPLSARKFLDLTSISI